MRFVLLLILSVFSASAATICMGPSSSGSGSGADWSNQMAYSSHTPTRGNTYYCRGGTGYGDKVFTVAASGTTRIVYIKATASDHVTETGWVTAYGTDVAEFGKVSINNSSCDYLTFNGQVGDYGTSVAYGFKFSQSTAGEQTFNFDFGGANSILKYCEFAGPGGTTDYDHTADTACLAFWGGQAEGTLVQNCYLHGGSTLMDGGDDSLIVEYCYLKDSRSSNPAAHSNVWYCGGSSTHVTFRFNKVSNFNDEGVFITWYSTASSPPDNIWIYGNTFHSPGTTNPRGVEIRQFDSGGSFQTYTNILVYNNTFCELSTGAFLNRATESGLGSSTGCAYVNNLEYSASTTLGDTATVANNTTLAGTTGFVSYTTDLRLLAATSAGTTLSSPYDTDALGVTRGADGVWDRGAFEYTGGDSSTYRGFSFGSGVKLIGAGSVRQ